jgi:hypothetical protein
MLTHALTCADVIHQNGDKDQHCVAVIGGGGG